MQTILLVAPVALPAATAVAGWLLERAGVPAGG
jgi:hypothetical protein